jgi:hypothetical protein
MRIQDLSNEVRKTGPQLKVKLRQSWMKRTKESDSKMSFECVRGIFHFTKIKKKQRNSDGGIFFSPRYHKNHPLFAPPLKAAQKIPEQKNFHFLDFCEDTHPLFLVFLI